MLLCTTDDRHLKALDHVDLKFPEIFCHLAMLVEKMCLQLLLFLYLQVEKLLLLWTQLQNCLELMKKIRVNKVTNTELVRRRKILERRLDHLMLTKRRTRLEPVMKEQREVEYEEVERLCEEVTKLGRLPIDPSKCEVTFPTAMTVMNRDITNDNS